MRTKWLSLVAVGVLTALTAACSSSEQTDDENSGDELDAKNLGAGSFGLEKGEIALTLDDGPGARTVQLVDYLRRADVKVPATFFEVGKNAAANPAWSKYIADHSAEVPGGLIVANHSLTHTDPLPKQGVTGSINEIMEADKILTANIAASQAQFDHVIPMFRPPYGAFTALGAANVEKVNNAGASKYVGPIFWEIGGELANGFSADWACWGKAGMSLDACAKGYVAEAKARGKGIMLCHDVHNKTVEMLTGERLDATGKPQPIPGYVGLIKQLKDAGFKFVSLRKNDAAVHAYGVQQDQAQAQNAQINATADIADNGTITVTYDVAAVGGAKGVVSFDRAPTPQEIAAANGKGGTITKSGLGAGQHVVYVSSIGADGKVALERRFNLIVPSVLDDPNDDGEGNACSNYKNLTAVRKDGGTAGRPFKVFIKQVPCGKPYIDSKGVEHPIYTAVPNECYLYNGTAKVAAVAGTKTAAVKSNGGDEWSVQYDLGFASDANDKSKLSLIIETGNGHIVTGKRHGFPGSNREVPFHETSVDCENGIWRGVLGTEEFLFRSPTADEPEYEDR